MEIKRNGYSSIIKQKIDTNKLKPYDADAIEESKLLLQQSIGYVSNSFDMLTIMRKNYNGSLSKTYQLLEKENYDSVRYQCFYYTKELNKHLKDIGIETYFLTHKARLYALSSGDNKVKEAHISLIYPSIKNDRVLYTIFDPGLKVDKPISFFKEDIGLKINEDKLKVSILGSSDEDYPYKINIDGVNPYSYNSNPHNVHQYFNPDFITANINDLLFPISYKLLTGYKAMVFSKIKEERAYIVLNHLSKYLEFCDFSDGVVYKYSFSDIIKMERSELKQKLNNICIKLGIDIEEIVENVYFMVDIVGEYTSNFMDNEVVKEYHQKVRKK